MKIKRKLKYFGVLTILLIMPQIGTPAVAAQRINPATDLKYLGAFRLPDEKSGGTSWAYGGTGLTYYPKGDPRGAADGFPGSLFGIGHRHHDLVSEFTIPKPVVSPTKNVDDLPEAKTLQPFADITGGLRDKVEVDELGGLAYLPKQNGQSTDKIYWTIYEYYNVSGTDYLSHGWSELNLAEPKAQGAWHVGPTGTGEYHSMKSANYIFDISKSWADQNVGGKYLASGRHRSAGAFGSSEGPALYAFGPYNDGNPPPYGAELDAVALIWYPRGDGYYPGYCADDKWEGGAWLTAGEKSAVVIVGSKGLGEKYYGKGRPGDCDSHRGYHCDPYEPQFIFYDTDELAAVASGKKKPYKIVPYAVFRPAQYLWDRCRIVPGGAAYDRERRILYVAQTKIRFGKGRYYPVVHVFRVE